MKNEFILIIIGSTIINYLLRVLPVVTHGKIKTGKFLKSFLEYVPYTALGTLLFPDVLYSTGNINYSIIALLLASVLLLLKKNMILVVFLTILAVYCLNNFI